jgi:hypothetical protein
MSLFLKRLEYYSPNGTNVMTASVVQLSEFLATERRCIVLPVSTN